MTPEKKSTANFTGRACPDEAGHYFVVLDITGGCVIKRCVRCKQYESHTVHLRGTDWPNIAKEIEKL